MDCSLSPGQFQCYETHRNMFSSFRAKSSEMSTSKAAIGNTRDIEEHDGVYRQEKKVKPKRRVASSPTWASRDQE